MKNYFKPLAAIIWLSCSALQANAEQCSLADFDRGPPPSVKDTTPTTTESQFEWGSDVDRADARAWHYIKNLHAKKLSLDWQKPRLVIPFYNPLVSGDTICKFDYGSLDSFKLDHDAPIRVSNDGTKSAEAYIQITPSQQSSMTGGELRRSLSSRRNSSLFWEHDRYRGAQPILGPEDHFLSHRAGMLSYASPQ
jgi:hypothetical protein